MGNQENEIEKAITKTIADYNSKIEFYKSGIKKLNDTLNFFKKGEAVEKPKVKTNHGGARPNSGRKKLTQKESDAILSTVPKKRGKYKKHKNKQKYRNGLKPVNWNKVIFPLLQRKNRPMTATQMVGEIFKHKMNKNKAVFKDRMYSALCTLKNKGLIESEKIDGITHYSSVDFVNI
jgi:hypothetical protein